MDSSKLVLVLFRCQCYVPYGDGIREYNCPAGFQVSRRKFMFHRGAQMRGHGSINSDGSRVEPRDRSLFIHSAWDPSINFQLSTLALVTRPVVRASSGSQRSKNAKFHNLIHTHHKCSGNITIGAKIHCTIPPLASAHPLSYLLVLAGDAVSHAPASADCKSLY